MKNIVPETVFQIGKYAKIYDGSNVLAEGEIVPYEEGSIYGAKEVEQALCIRLKDKGIVVVESPYRFEVDGVEYKS